MDKLDFVFVSLQRINTDRDSTSTAIAKELAKTHRVLYVNPPIDRKTLWFGSDDPYISDHINLLRSKQTPDNLEKADDNLWVLTPLNIIESINWIPHTSVFKLLNRRNNSVFGTEIQTALNKIGFERFILINDKDIFRSFYLKEILRPRLSVYLDRDYIVGMDYWKRHGTKLEPDLYAKSDLVLCNSPGFTQQAMRYNPNSFYIGNGCDITLFDPARHYDVPEEIATLRDRPIVGYVGALLDIRLDIPLLVYLAESRPAWNLLLIGPEDEAFANSTLHTLPNVIFLGKIENSLAPAYIRYFDVCINPQIRNTITEENFPLKINEYLAMGKPTVATKTNVMEQVFSSVVSLASSQEEFLHCIETCLESDTQAASQARINCARSFSWDKIAQNVVEIITQHLK
ncbi:glycosyltransferase [Parapedobacter deserti]|uniref:Glycosyltransferase n=1 Tax=Parapedobacter deserti TaxID=1912957 RepID=A0ABV7JDK9_9SPHI